MALLNVTARRAGIAHGPWPGLSSTALLIGVLAVYAVFLYRVFDHRFSAPSPLLFAIPETAAAFFALLPASLLPRTAVAAALSVIGASLAAPCLVVACVIALRQPYLIDPPGSAMREYGYFVGSELPLPALLAWLAGLPWRALRRSRRRRG